MHCRRARRNENIQPEIYSGKTGVDLPVINLEPLSSLVMAAATGPDGGLTEVPPVLKKPALNLANLDDELLISGLDTSVASAECCAHSPPHLCQPSTSNSIIDCLEATPYGLESGLLLL